MPRCCLTLFILCISLALGVIVDTIQLSEVKGVDDMSGIDESVGERFEAERDGPYDYSSLEEWKDKRDVEEVDHDDSVYLLTQNEEVEERTNERYRGDQSFMSDTEINFESSTDDSYIPANCSCNNNGDCWSDGVNTFCICYENFYGDTCADPVIYDIRDLEILYLSEIIVSSLCILLSFSLCPYPARGIFFLQVFIIPYKMHNSLRFIAENVFKVILITNLEIPIEGTPIDYYLLFSDSILQKIFFIFIISIVTLLIVHTGIRNCCKGCYCCGAELRIRRSIWLVLLKFYFIPVIISFSYFVKYMREFGDIPALIYFFSFPLFFILLISIIIYKNISVYRSTRHLITHSDGWGGMKRFHWKKKKEDIDIFKTFESYDDDNEDPPRFSIIKSPEKGVNGMLMDKHAPMFSPYVIHLRGNMIRSLSQYYYYVYFFYNFFYIWLFSLLSEFSWSLIFMASYRIIYIILLCFVMPYKRYSIFWSELISEIVLVTQLILLHLFIYQHNIYFLFPTVFLPLLSFISCFIIKCVAGKLVRNEIEYKMLHEF